MKGKTLVAMAALALWMSPSLARAQLAGAFGDWNNGSIIVSRDDGQLTWIKRSGNSLTGVHNFNVSVDGGATDDPRALVLGDFDGDNNGDIIVARGGNPSSFLTWVERTPINTMTGVHSFNVSSANGIAIGELGDGANDDVIVTRDDGFITWSLENPGFSQITANTSFNMGSAVGAAIGNFDGDADGDTLVIRSDGFITWAERSGTNLTGIHSTNVTPGVAVTMGDMDNEGLDDAIVGRADGFVTWVEHAGGTISGVNSFNVGSVADLVYGGDPDADGDGDVYVAQSALGGAVLRLERIGNALTTPFAGFTAAGAGQSLTSIDTGDLDGDGFLDIIVGRSDGEVLWLEDNLTSIGFVASFNVGSNVLDLKIASVPEPATVTLLGMGCVAMLRRRKR